VVWTGSIWLRIGTSGRLLVITVMNLRFHKMLGSSCVAAELGASQEGLTSMSE
jgi:hypothetical protein